MQSILLPHMLAARFRHITASAHAVIQKTQHAQHIFTHRLQSRVSPALQCTAESNACLPCQAFCCLICLLQDSGTAQLQHMQYDSELTACRAHDRQHSHRPQSRVSPAVQYTAENNACLPCKAFCCLICLLQDSGTLQLQHMQ